MGKKYLDTKEGSLEQSVLGVWQTAIEEGDARMDGRTKGYKEHRAKLEAARLRKEKLTKKQKQLDVDGDGEIEGSDLAKLRKKAKKEEVEESYEIGTDEYRKHTEDVTPGENGEWAKHVGEKSQSMREALAKVWGVNEGKSPFKKEEKKSLTKEVKDGKTMTGKKIASVDINPTIKEKTK